MLIFTYQYYFINLVVVTTIFDKLLGGGGWINPEGNGDPVWSYGDSSSLNSYAGGHTHSIDISAFTSGSTGCKYSSISGSDFLYKKLESSNIIRTLSNIQS